MTRANMAAGILMPVAFLVLGMAAWNSLAGAPVLLSSSWLVRAGFVALLYMGAHVMRILRLALILGQKVISLRRLALVHIHTAGVSAAIPFKLGEAYRIFEIGRANRSWGAALISVLIERIFDAAIMLIFILLPLLFGMGMTFDMLLFTGGVFAFLAMSAVLFLIVPENLPRLQMYLIRRYHSPWNLKMLAGLGALDKALSCVWRMLKGKYATIGLLTVAIWTLEMAALGLAIPALIETPGRALTAPLALLSSAFVENAPIIGGGDSAALYAMATAGLLYLSAIAAGLAYLLFKPIRRKGLLS
ncbi:MAG: lysylphosphatidylglycerol synthase domain-containing protein [Pseudomonadota bacterium]|nr:lysylphosphatidylglycerol synthase domain-containing protein [Pseudomonadota bacterium]